MSTAVTSCRFCRLLTQAVSAALLLACVPLASWGQFRDASEELGFSGGGKAAFADYNGDGWIDVYAGGKLFRNEGGKKFVVVSDAGVPGGEVIWGDYDNDGHPDLFQFTGAGSLHRNKGDGTFEQQEFPALPTVNSRGAVWIDINNDSQLDLYVGGYEIWQQAVHPDAIYLNEGGGKFTKHWQSADGNYSARGVTAADFNEDGYVDVYVSNYRLQPNHLWKNGAQGKGVFTNVAMEVGAAGKPSQVIPYTGGITYPVCGHTIGSCFGDLDNDGHLDIFVGNFAHAAAYQNRPQFLRNLGPDGEYKFEDKSEGAGLGYQESYASPALGDYDNDGDLDLYFTTVYGGNFPVLYRNEGDWKFTNVTAEEKIPNLSPTYQAAWADIDNDGDLDLCTAGKLFVNEGRPHHWLEVALRGDGKRVTRTAVGARVSIRLGERLVTRQVEAGTGEGNQNALRLHFGLGTHEGPVDLEIVWPGKSVQRVEGLAANQLHRVEYDATEP